MNPTTDKMRAVEQALAMIEKQFGKGSIMRMGSNHMMQVETVSTSSISLDLALGGGMPKGRIIEVYGPESSGKTTLCYHVMAQIQKEGGQAAYIDAEHAFDPNYAANTGVDIDNLLISQPDSGEQALEITETLLRSGAVDIIVVDSVAALTPKAELEGDMGDSHMGLQARLMSQALRKLTSIISKTNTVVIFVNQLRMKIGVMFGNPETTTGGNALKFYASVRVDIRKKAAIEQGVGDDKQSLGVRVKAKIVKNKIAAPFRTAEFDIMFNEGISREGDLLDTGVNLGIITKSGAFFSYDDTKLGQGRENAKTYLREHKDITNGLETKIRAQATANQAAGKKPGASVSSPTDDDNDDDSEEE